MPDQSTVEYPALSIVPVVHGRVVHSLPYSAIPGFKITKTRGKGCGGFLGSLVR